MNSNCFKTVFSQRHGALVAVGEHASSQGKANGAHGANGAASLGAQSFGFAHVMRHFMGAVTASFALVALAWAQPALNALPAGGQVAQGVVQFSQSAQQLNISQASDRAAVNWQSFDIGAAAKVNVVQPSAQSVLLNRVGGTAPSQIFGQLSANGRVILVNPNGMVFGKDGSVSASAFTGSTLNISDADFMAGNERYTRDGAAGAIVNRGLIQAAPGGYVALLGASVSNEGRIVAPQGDVYLAAADAVTMPANAVALPIGQSGRIKLELTPASINAAVANQKGGTIVTEGGQVYLQAAAVNAALATIIQSGSIDTTGEQGGAVHVLADGGHIRVDGSIKANSTNGTAGGDIYIGRDEGTGVLAKTTDVSNAKLESNKGFVETSGDYLATDGVAIKAAQWLLDPSDVTISSGNDADYTNMGGTYTPNASAGTSVVKVNTIQGAINNGTSVTITTTNTEASGSGAGNITIANALNFTNATTTKATLSLIADNGITQNAAITTTGGTGLVHVSMEAKGNYQGGTAESNNSKGITLNSTITTNGTVTLTGTSKDTTGIQTGPTYTYGVTNNSRSGVVFNNGSGITADNFQVTGTHTVAAGDSFGVNGVYMNGTVTFKATGNTDSNITGNSNAQGNFGAGLMVMDGATIRLENQGTGVTTLKGSNTNTGGGNGVRIGAGTNTAVINAIGRVTLGQQAAGTNAPTFIRSTINASQNNVGQSGLRIVGQTGLNTSAVQIWDTNINGTGIDVVVDGITANAAGVYIQNSNNTTWKVKNLTVTGVANTTAGSSGSGVVVQRFPNVLTVNASGNIDIQGTVEDGGNGSGLSFAQSGWGPQSPSLTATGNITLRGNNRASTSNTSNAVSIGSGVQVSAGGNIVLQAETKNETVAAINVASSGSFSSWAAAANVGAGALFGNMSLTSTSGDVLIQSNQGSIVLNNQLTSTLVNDTQTTSTDISGRNITIDNTGAGMITGASNTVGSGSIDGTTGVIIAGSGKATGTGINLADTRSIIASGNLNIMGVSSGGGAGVVNRAALTAAQNVTVTGESVTGNGIITYAAITATNGDAKIIGTSTGVSANAAALSLQGAIVAGRNVEIKGANTSSANTGVAVLINKNVTAANGKIDVTASAAGATPNALKIESGVNIFGNTEVNITTDTLNINTANASINAGNGAGLATIKNDTPGTMIDNDDGLDIGTGVRTLRLSNAELNRIKAGNLVIGSSTAGNITIAQPTTSNTTEANITLETGKKINVNAALAAASGKNLTLKAIGDINVNKAISQSGAGNIVLAAGYGLGKGVDSGGQVKRADTGTVSNASGKTYIYTGSVASSAKMSDLNNTAFGTLTLGTNAQSNTATDLANTITDSLAKMQVMYREKIAVDLSGNNTLDNATKTYGDVAKSTVDADAQTAIKLANANKTLSWIQDGNTFNLSSDALVDTLSVANVTDASYSNADKLKASATVYDTTSSTYSVSSQSLPTLRITKKAITLTGAVASDKVYDGTDTATLTNSGVLTGGASNSTDKNYYDGDNVQPTYTGAKFTDGKNVKFDSSGNVLSQGVTIQSLALVGLDRDNYTVTDASSNLSAKITPKALSVDISYVETTYGKVADTGSVLVSGMVDGDDVKFSTSSSQLTGSRLSSSGNLRVGTYVQVGSVAVTGGVDRGNYTGSSGASFNYVVTPMQITATATAADKVYDGNTSATLVASGVGILAGDVVTVQGLTGNFASKNVARDGSGNVVAQDVLITGTGSSLGGTDGANYTLVGTTSVPAASARITPKDLSLAGITAADKVYDGTTTAQLSSANAVLTGLVAGDSVNVSAQNAQGNFVDKNVARGANGQPVAKQVLVSGLVLAGADQGNYQLGSSADVSATITPRTVSLLGSRALDKVVDGTTTAQVLPGTLEGLVAGEQLGVNASGEFEDALVGSNKLVNARFALVNGSNGLASNYDLTNTTAALRAAIVAFVPNTLNPDAGVSTGSSGNRVRFSGSSGAGAATGVSDEPAGAELTEQCSVLNPQLCECEDTKIPGVEMCFAPTQVVSLKD